MGTDVVEPMSLSVEPLAPFGAVVRGVSVTGPIQPAAVAWIKSYLYQYGLIVLRGQPSPSDDAFSGFVHSFGHVAEPAVQGEHRDDSMAAIATRQGSNEIVLLTNKITENEQPVGYQIAGQRGLGWHSDYSWAKVVSSMAALEALVVPSWGGETAFANMYAAYDALEPDVRALVGRLSALHCMPVNRDWREEGEEDLRLSSIRPLVITNPYTGRRALYLSNLYTTRIVGLPADEAAELWRHLIEFSTSPRFVLEHHWIPGDIVMWDEIGLIHCRRPFDESEPRMMRQIALLVDDEDAPWVAGA